jgi:hypothetical protein
MAVGAAIISILTTAVEYASKPLEQGKLLGGTGFAAGEDLRRAGKRQQNITPTVTPRLPGRLALQPLFVV